MVQGFQEGLDISLEFDFKASEPYGNRNGFELLRQLTKEFSLRNRAEALSLKTQLLARVFAPELTSERCDSPDRSSMCSVCENGGILGAGMASELQITDCDQLSFLVRSLSNDARSYALMHSSGESCQQHRISAGRLENQHRLFKDLVSQRRTVVNLVEDFSTQEMIPPIKSWLRILETRQKKLLLACLIVRILGVWSAIRNVTIHHLVHKLKCFKCGQLGHASLNCRVKKSPNGKLFPSKGVEKSPQKGQKGSSSGKESKKSSKGKKGKMFAVLDENGSWWYTECAVEEKSTNALQDGVEDENSGVLVLNCVLPQLDSLVVGDSLIAVLMHLRMQMKRTLILIHLWMQMAFCILTWLMMILMNLNLKRWVQYAMSRIWRPCTTETGLLQIGVISEM